MQYSYVPINGESVILEGVQVPGAGLQFPAEYHLFNKYIPKVLNRYVNNVLDNNVNDIPGDTLEEVNFLKQFKKATGGNPVISQTNPVTGEIGFIASRAQAPSILHFGQIASRCAIPTFIGGANKQLMSRTKHVAFDDLESVSLAYAAYYVDQGIEHSPGADSYYTASIEYPIGTITAVTFNGADQGVAPNGGYVVSDPCSVKIPKGAAFFVRTWQSNANGALWQSRRSLANVSGSVPLSGEWYAVGATTPDLTKVATNSNNAMTTNSFVPLAILGYTKQPSVLILGDSRSMPSPTQDTAVNAFGGVGETERSIVKRYALINASSPGESLYNIQGSGFSKRAHLGKWVTHVVISLGINDFTAGRTSAAALTYLQTASVNLFAGKAIYACTVSPKSQSTDSWSTTVNQTPDPTSNANRVAYNNTLRSSPPPQISGVFEIADQTESARDSGRWKVTGSAFGFTTDGLHETSDGFELIEKSRIFADVIF